MLIIGRKIKDYTGQKFNKLTVLKLDIEKNNINETRYKNGEVKRRLPLYWFCECDCGKIISTQIQHLRHGDVQSCGCIMKANLTGQKFGRLTVLELDEDRNKEERERQEKGEIDHVSVYWRCECICGNISSVTTSGLTTGKIKSCGCYSKEVTSQIKSKKNDYDFLENNIVMGWDNKHEHFFLINQQDYEEVKKYCWSPKKGKVDGDFYWLAYKKGDGGHIALHQLIMSLINKNYTPSKNLIPDHIDRNPSNNVRTNLRLTNQQENGKNKKRSCKNTSGKQGVSWDKQRRKWHCYINKAKKKRIQKYFDTYEDAVEQRLLWEKEFGYIGE